MRTFITAAGGPLVNGRWYCFGGGFSLRHQGNGRLSIRHDLTGEVSYPAGPSGRDAIAMALYAGNHARAESYAYFCFGPALDWTIADLAIEGMKRAVGRMASYPFSPREIAQLHTILKGA